VYLGIYNVKGPLSGRVVAPLRASDRAGRLGPWGGGSEAGVAPSEEEAPSCRQKKWKRVSGQMRRSTLPTMRDLGMGPQNRLSQESPRLSPIMK